MLNTYTKIYKFWIAKIILTKHSFLYFVLFWFQLSCATKRHLSIANLSSIDLQLVNEKSSRNVVKLVHNPFIMQAFLLFKRHGFSKNITCNVTSHQWRRKGGRLGCHHFRVTPLYNVKLIFKISS